MENLPWKRQAAFRLQRYTNWFWPRGDGKPVKAGERKSVDKLSFVSIDDAGHLASGDQREAVSFLVSCWTTRVKQRQCLDLGW